MMALIKPVDAKIIRTEICTKKYGQLININESINITIPTQDDVSIQTYTLYRKQGTNEAELLETFTPDATLSYTDKDVIPGRIYRYYYVLTCKDGTSYPRSNYITVSLPNFLTPPTPLPTATALPDTFTYGDFNISRQEDGLVIT